MDPLMNRHIVAARQNGLRQEAEGERLARLASLSTTVTERSMLRRVLGGVAFPHLSRRTSTGHARG
jgi:hypothetical protein